MQVKIRGFEFAVLACDSDIAETERTKVETELEKLTDDNLAACMKAQTVKSGLTAKEWGEHTSC